MTTIQLKRLKMKKILYYLILLGGLAGAAWPASAQDATAPATPNYQPLSDPQLDQLLGPIALYPDPLIADILPASTLPTQIVLADRYVSGGGDTNQIQQQPWDASIQALAHYPSVLKWMDDNLNWTTVLGDAFLNQQSDVMNSVQRLRTQAQSLGNLSSTPQQQVNVDNGNVEIVPTDPDIIYIPEYDPGVIYYQSQFSYPFITFGVGFGIGWWLNCDFDWRHRNLIVWNHDHPRPQNWWHERGDRRYTTLANHGTVWRPTPHPGVGSALRGDRGWNNPADRRSVPTVNRLYTRPGAPQKIVNSGFRPNNNRPEFNHPANNPAVNLRPANNFQAPAEHFAPITRPPANDTFIGIQSPQQTRNFSDRGQQSMQTMPRPEPSHSEPAPAPRPAPSSGGGGGGGGRSGHR